MDKVITVNNLSFAYEEEPILKNVNLQVNRGDFLAFIGPNGSGKSTLLKLLLGLLTADQGEIKLLETEINDFTDWTKIGYIPQNVRNFNNSFPATVREVIGSNLYSEMNFFKLLTAELEERIDKALKLVNMLDYKDSLIGNLSGGQQQRIFIARTLVTEPEIIFLDEPLTGVDINAQNELYELLTKLNQELEITVTMVSHDLNSIYRYTDRIISVKNCQLVDKKQLREGEIC
ncbi:metal ABC transporter ATP-binding protein [Acetohalobium arabaticum]|uniref:ABC transporter related protein n=1 Tax=Acetohalobium arabaticum (strain ATCC 49924 / DSM 5501 / Z-7288) TaxID=574087 RepID=D9QRA6_ACEAZ|nr:metal ABC transporter ATP-binding protein [Acetohalobium arabaticum]ADL13047.1 ABC transporter related protein [Acetohalobium arabaticum DSM 5501]